ARHVDARSSARRTAVRLDEERVVVKAALENSLLRRRIVADADVHETGLSGRGDDRRVRRIAREKRAGRHLDVAEEHAELRRETAAVQLRIRAATKWAMRRREAFERERIAQIDVAPWKA